VTQSIVKLVGVLVLLNSIINGAFNGDYTREQKLFFYYVAVIILSVFVYLFFKLFKFINSKIERNYFVSYKYYTENGFKFGNVILVEPGPLFCFIKAQKQISNMIPGVDVVLIDYYKKITKKEFTKNNYYGEFS